MSNRGEIIVFSNALSDVLKFGNELNLINSDIINDRFLYELERNFHNPENVIDYLEKLKNKSKSYEAKYFDKATFMNIYLELKRN